MSELKLPKFRVNDVIIKNFYHSSGLIMNTTTKSDKMGSYVGIYDIPGKTTYTVEYMTKQTYEKKDEKWHHWTYKLKEAHYMFVYDNRIVDIEFDLYEEYMRGLKLKKIKKAINENTKI